MAERIIPSEPAPKQTETPNYLTEDEIRYWRQLEAEARARCGLPPRKPQEDTRPRQTEPKAIAETKALAEVADKYLATETEETNEANNIGYVMRSLVLATLPHSQVEGDKFVRRNGNFTLSIIASDDVGLPYGTIPRLILMWLTSEAVRTKSPLIEIGDSLSSFMRRLGLIPAGEKWGSGGRCGSITRLKDQMMRLLSCTITCRYDDGEKKYLKHLVPVDEALLWWNPVEPDQKNLWQSTLRISRPFFEEIVTAPVPIRMSTLEALKGSSLALDLYCWLTHRNFYAKRESRIPWGMFQNQFGSAYPTTAQGKRNFKKKCELALKKVGEAYSEAQKLRMEPDVLVYVPGKPDVDPIVLSEK